MKFRRRIGIYVYSFLYIEKNLPELEKHCYELADRCEKEFPVCRKEIELCNREKIKEVFQDARAKVEKIWEEKEQKALEEGAGV